jgi:hypothetical protein
MKLRSLLRSPLPLMILALIFCGACSDDEMVAPDETEVSPLTAAYWPIEEGSSWSFVRMETGLDYPNPLYNTDLPVCYTLWEVLPPQGAGDYLLRGTNTTDADGGGDLLRSVDLEINSSVDGLEILSENTDGAVDTSYTFRDYLPYNWIQFGKKSWTAFEVSYSSASIETLDTGGLPVTVDYRGEEVGKILLSSALGFDYARSVYDGGDLPGNRPYDSSDMDYDGYVDGILSVKLVGEVVEERDLSYSIFGEAADSLFPRLKDVVFENCKVVRLSLVADIFLTNQRNPNAGPGEEAINPQYEADFAIVREMRKDLQLMLFAKHVGPVFVATYHDLDKHFLTGDFDMEQLILPPEIEQYDILIGGEF